MYILLALIGACVLGIAAHYLIPERPLRGVAMTPGIATALAAAAYTTMQWAGVGQDSIWLWLASVLGSVVVASLITLAVVALRRRSDAEARAALGI
ncbi:hypothetical protein [Microbacterium sp. XT11]|uniref:hypothetical protein n=1 Tax=Microbacterium sp. XT11 TaxID=367477 RepID=UPI000742EEA6|nr:hypothetical protein [Microbacterium sp. XT11]ALX66665.1 hypothetical protein AB663_001978 [Microbacterium sp. XT11]